MSRHVPSRDSPELRSRGENVRNSELGTTKGDEVQDIMKIFDILLTLLLPSLILFHLLCTPYSKVEESFNLQATHDILTHGIPLSDIHSGLRSYDHNDFPGAVPRTFIGAVILAALSRPILFVVDGRCAQLVVRGLLGLFNAFALLRFKNGLQSAFGSGTARWYLLLQASQFHVVYYASRTLPNMFAFGLCTLALRELLPMPVDTTLSSKGTVDQITRRNRLAIFLLVFAAVVFRAELAILLVAQLAYLLWQPRISLETAIPIGLRSALVAVGISALVDSYFWQRPIWPELVGFIYNAIQGKSIEWGTSPFHAYFTIFLPKLLLNPIIPLVLIPSALYFPATRRAALGLVVPSLAFISIYSIQPHKEARFILYAVPPLTACAAIGANYIFTHRSRSLYNRVISLIVIASIIGSFAASTVMLAISSLNYPGGEALYRLHEIAAREEQHIPSQGLIHVHMDVSSCMTGITRFQQDFPSPPISLLPSISALLSLPFTSKTQTRNQNEHHYQYDKTESPSLLLDPLFWTRFDYILMAQPETAIGAWEILDTIYGYAGLQLIRPGEENSASSAWLKLWMGIEENVNRGLAKSEAAAEAEAAWIALGGEAKAEDESTLEHGKSHPRHSMEDPKEMNSKGLNGGREREHPIYTSWCLLREGIRKYLTRGWWIDVRMEPKIRILKRAGLA